MIPVCQPTVSECDIAAVANVMRSRWLSTGSVVKEFEAALCERTGYQHCVALSNCTAAMFLTLKAYGIGPGSRVGVPALTFSATAAVVEHTGASVKFLDVDRKHWLMPELTGDFDAVIPVDLYGQLAWRDTERFDTPDSTVVVEDAAHAMGAALSNRAETVCLSFYATKNITTAGEGGAVLTNNASLADWVRRASLHGLSGDAWSRYSGMSRMNHAVVQLGYKANMTDCQAAMGITQLSHLDEWRAARERIAARYDARLGLPTVPRFESGIAHLYPVLLPDGVDRNYFRTRLQARGVGTGIHFNSLTDEPYWQDRYHASCPVAEKIGRSVVSLPLYPHLTEGDQDKVISEVHKCLK